ncbi:MAG: hypothetical protein M3Q56_00995 [Bacteroidota bacterium]|nr:hypothetical protein [Bacteroidota bacterium]
MRIPLFLFVVLYVSTAFGQNHLAIGQWETHLPFNSGLSVTQSDQFVYYATEFAILKIKKSDRSIEKISRTEGLNGSSPITIFFHKPSSKLIVAHTNALLDIVHADGIDAIVDIQNFNNLPIDKIINSISYADSSRVFINADFGLSLLNLNDQIFEFTLFTPNIPVYKTIQFKGKYYSITAKGLYVFDPESRNLVQDFSSWNLMGQTSGLPENVEFRGMAIFKDELFVGSQSRVYKMNNQEFFDVVRNESNYTVQYLEEGVNHLLVGLKCNSTCGNKVLLFDEQNQWHEIAGSCVEQNIYTIEDASGTLWYADQRWSFRTMADKQANCESMYINGPSTNSFFEITPASDAVYIAAGGVDATWTYLYNDAGVYKYKENVWSDINRNNTALFLEEDIKDILRVVEHPDGNKMYFASFHRGIVEFDKQKNEFVLFDDSNSTLQNAVGDASRIRVSGLAFDQEKTLWASVFLSPKPLVSYSKDGIWRSYSLPQISTQVINVKVDLNGYKWVIPREAVGVLVFDEGKPEDPGDDRSILLNSSNSEIKNNRVNTVEVDLEGDVWVGTQEGPIVFECGSNIFDGDCRGSRRKVDQDGIIGYLLETEDVISIAVDGGNRKWFGTRNGLYVQSASGDEQIYLFTDKNSPLLNNSIFDVAVDAKTGEAWIGTDRGIQVFRSDATLAKDFFTGTATVFPNPVEPNYNGPIAIQGLARDARVKITDITGRLVREVIANGGTAIWDGKDYLGVQAASGTYLVFVNTTIDIEKSEGIVTKILLIR